MPASTQAIRRFEPAPWEGCMAAGAAARIGRARRQRWLQVTAGRVWLTRTEDRPGPHADHWLHAGERLALPAGSEWVAESAAGEARYLLLESPR